MSDINITRPHALPLAKARAIVQKAAEELADEYELQSEWTGDILHFRRTGIEGDIQVNSNDIALTMKLGFLLRPFKDKIEQRVGSNLDQLLAAGSVNTMLTKKAVGGATSKV